MDEDEITDRAAERGGLREEEKREKRNEDRKSSGNEVYSLSLGALPISLTFADLPVYSYVNLCAYTCVYVCATNNICMQKACRRASSHS